MEIATKDYIIHTVFKTNILPVISECNTACIFCSHRQNPESVEVFKMPRLKLSDFEEIIEYLSPARKIVIGESATRIIEGEPLLHKDFFAILALVRKKFRNTSIQVTTNGILLTQNLVEKMAELGNIELNISINCVDEHKRRKILGLSKDDDIRNKIRLLKNRLRFSGSSVYMPHIMGYEDIEEIAGLLDECGADNFRLFLPGYTSRTYTGPVFGKLYDEMQIFLGKLRNRYSLPVIIEPSIITDLSCRIEGIIKGTPAYEAGMQFGDVILEVNGIRPRTRVEAFNLVYSLSMPELSILRENDEKEIKLHKKKNVSPGFMMLYDMDPQVLDDIASAVLRHNAQSVFIMTSEMAKCILEKLFAANKMNFTYRVIGVKNRFFGGTINCAGLLMLQDVFEAVQPLLEKNERPDLIFLPPVMLDHRRRDLLGESIKALEERLEIPVDTV